MSLIDLRELQIIRSLISVRPSSTRPGKFEVWTDYPFTIEPCKAFAPEFSNNIAAGSSSACRSCCYHLQIIQAKKLVTHGNVGRTLHSRLATTYTTEISQITGIPEPEEEIEIEGYSEADDQPGDAGEQLEGAVQPEDDRGDHHHLGVAVEEAVSYTHLRAH